MTSTMQGELQELRAAAESYGARHVHLEHFAYPPGTRMAVSLTVDFDAMLLRRASHEPPMQLAKGEFGGRVGIWRLLELFASHSLHATIFTPGRICELYPQAVVAAARAGPRDCRSHVGASRAQGTRARIRPPGQIHAGPRTPYWSSPCRDAQPSHPGVSHTTGLYLHLNRNRRSSAVLCRRCAAPEHALKSAIPLRHRRCHVFQFWLDWQWDAGTAPGRPGERAGRSGGMPSSTSTSRAAT